MATTPRLFISHSHEDDAFCRRLIADLRANLGEDAVWYDASGGLHGGDEWWDRIVAEITERPYFLVVLSPAASASNWVPQEMKIAFRQHVELGKRLLPVRLADSPCREDWKGIQEFDFTHADDPARYAVPLAEVLQAIDSNLTTPIIGPSSAAPTPAEPERPLSAIERLAREAHTAYGREHWSDVLDKTQILIERNAMTPTLWRERASAAYQLGDTNEGLAAIEQALWESPDDPDILLLNARLFVKSDNDWQAIDPLTRAYTLVQLDDTSTRLLILDELTAALGRLRRWDEFIRRIGDARRLAPNESRWIVRLMHMLQANERFDEAITAAKSIPKGMDVTPLLSTWKASVAATAKTGDWASRRQFLQTALDARVAPAVVASWRHDFPAFAPLLTLDGNSGNIIAIAWLPNGMQVAAVHGDGTARIWDVNSGHILASLRGPPGEAEKAAWSPDRRLLATVGADHTIQIWDARNERPIAVLSNRDSYRYSREYIADVAWAPSGARLAAAYGDSSGYYSVVRIWEVVSQRELVEIPSPDPLTAPSIAWSPDGTRLAIALHQRHLMQIWEADTGHLIAEVGDGDPNSVTTCVSWSPNGRLLALGNLALGAFGDGSYTEIWGITGQLLFTLSGYRGVISDIAWTHDSNRLATAGGDTTQVAGRLAGGGLITFGDHGAKIWDTTTGQLLATLSGHTGAVHSVAWSPDSTRLATASENHAAMIWGEE